MKTFNKILVANRGEIAVRIIRAAREMGIKTAAIYAAADQDGLHRYEADEAIRIGEEALEDTYLNIGKIINAALESHSEAIHPGYGFLAENPELVLACKKSGLVFIGPSAEVMTLMGNKIKARAFIKSINIPLVEGAVHTKTEILIRKGKKIGFPLLLKAAAGGGGKGMRIVSNEAELNDGLEATSREARSYFGDGTVYIEKYMENPRHIEFQILGDHHGNVVHVCERECSIQRRYQKIIEEAPSVTLTQAVRKEMGDAAVRIARETGYTNAGTIEFLVDENLNFFFLEMNTRIQVEHPVTEMTTGIDLIKEQIRISSGHKLTVQQNQIRQKGHAIEARIYAEDPSNGFMPSPGKMNFYREPEGAGIRIDSSVNRAAEVRSLYDPMISKLIVYGKDRIQAIRRLEKALGQYTIHGIKTNTGFLRSVCNNKDFQSNRISTGFCEQHEAALVEHTRSAKSRMGPGLPLAAFIINDLNRTGTENHAVDHKRPFIWKKMGYWRSVMNIPVRLDGKTECILIQKVNNSGYEFVYRNETLLAECLSVKDGAVRIKLNNMPYTAIVSHTDEQLTYISIGGHTWKARRADVLEDIESYGTGDSRWMENSNSVTAPMPGKVIKVCVKEGSEIKRGEELLIIEAMKMENKILAPRAGKIKKLNVAEGQMVDGGAGLVELE